MKKIKMHNEKRLYQGNSGEVMDIRSKKDNNSTCLWVLEQGGVFENIDLASLSLDTSISQGHIAGGSGGVYVLKDKAGRRYTLKTSSTEYQLKDECLSDAIYHSMEQHVPNFGIYRGLPAALAADLKLPEGSLFRLAEFIEKNIELSHEDTVETIKKKLPDGYVIDCFLGNSDVAGDWQNVLVDKEKQVWRIDNGSTLRFRAQGALKELRVKVDELDSMKSVTEMMREVFGSITDAAIQKQVTNLLKNREKLIKLFYDMHAKIGFEKPDMLFQILVNRLQYLHEHVSQDLYAYSPRKSEACCGYTAAGTLICAEKAGEKYALLAKRMGHEYWGSFGGASDLQDIYLSDTAARESNEELLGIYQITQSDLEKAPAHDLLVEKMPEEKSTRLSVPKFRMYFVDKEYIDPDEFNKAIGRENLEHTSLEHTEFTWVKVKDLLNVDKSGDVSSVFSEGRVIELHPPLARMLEQEAVRKRLEQIDTTQEIDKHITRSRISQRYPANIQKKTAEVGPDDITPKAEWREITETMSKKQRMQQELVQQDEKKSRQAAHEKVTSDTDTLTQSEICLRVQLGEDYKPKALAENVAKFFDEKRKLKDVLITQKHKELFEKMIQVEKAHLDKFVFYHATLAQLGFIYDVFTEFRRQLEHQYHGDFHVLRGLDDFFAEFEDIITFKRFHEIDGRISDAAGTYQEVGLSVNPFITGSDGEHGECTYKFLVENESISPPDVSRLLNYFLGRLGLHTKYADFENIFKAFREKAGGNCYQIFIDPSVVDQVAYPAKAFGELNKLSVDDKDVSQFSEVMSSLRQDPVKFQEYIKLLQARLFLRPDIFHDPEKVQIHSWQTNPMTEAEKDAYQTAIQDKVSETLVKFISEYKTMSESLFHKGKPGLLRVAEMMNEQQALPIEQTTDKEINVFDMIARKNIKELINYLKENKNIDLCQTEITRDYMSSGEQTTRVLIRNILNSIYGYSVADPAKRDALLTNLIAEMSEENKLRLMKEIKPGGAIMLHRLVDFPDFIKAFLLSLPERDRLEVIESPDGEGKTLLHHACKHSDTLKAILEFYPPERRLAAILLPDLNNCESVLQQAAVQYPDSLKIIFQLYPLAKTFDLGKLMPGMKFLSDPSRRLLTEENFKLMCEHTEHINEIAIGLAALHAAGILTADTRQALAENAEFANYLGRGLRDLQKAEIFSVENRNVLASHAEFAQQIASAMIDLSNAGQLTDHARKLLSSKPDDASTTAEMIIDLTRQLHEFLHETEQEQHKSEHFKLFSSTAPAQSTQTISIRKTEAVIANKLLRLIAGSEETFDKTEFEKLATNDLGKVLEQYSAILPISFLDAQKNFQDQFKLS